MKVYQSLCKHCGVPVLSGRVDRTLHPACRKAYVSSYQKDWMGRNIVREKEKRRVHSENFRKEKPKAKMLSSAKQRAKKSSTPFDLSLEDIPDWGVCPVLGVKMEPKTRYAPSLDKISPQKGYVKGNIQVISRLANTMKQDATQEELERFAKWVLKI